MPATPSQPAAATHDARGGYPAVIPVAGHGTRMAKLTQGAAKELLPLAGRPVLEHVLTELHDAGVREVVLISRPGKPDIDEFAARIRRDERLDLHLEVRHQGPVSGNGGAILTGAQFFDGRPFLVVWGDEVFAGPSRTAQLIAAYEDLRAPVISLIRVSDEQVASCAIADGEPYRPGIQRILELHEKPDPAAVRSRWGSVGGFLLDGTVTAQLERTPPSADGEIYLSTALDAVARNGSLFGAELPAEWFDTGSVAGYARACAEFPVTGPNR